MKIKKLLYFFLPFVFLAMAMLAKDAFVINVTNSMELGIYLKRHGIVKSGDIVLLCLDKNTQHLGLNKHYLEPGNECNETASPLIKRVIAIPGDDVLLRDNNIVVNNIHFPYKTLYQDSSNQLLHVFPRGRYKKTNGYWVIGTNAKNSWDSRYWGFIQRPQIIAKLLPLFTWKS